MYVPDITAVAARMHCCSAHVRITCYNKVMLHYLGQYRQPWLMEGILSELKEDSIRTVRERPYVGLHIRRGDKVEEREAKRFDAKARNYFFPFERGVIDIVRTTMSQLHRASSPGLVTKAVVCEDLRRGREKSCPTCKLNSNCHPYPRTNGATHASKRCPQPAA